MADEKHDLILRKVTQRADKVLFAALNGLNKDPPEINGKIPDAIVEIDGEQIIVEVETCDSITLSETKEQYRAFSADGRKVRVYTPKDCVTEALNTARKWGFANIGFFYFKDV